MPQARRRDTPRTWDARDDAYDGVIMTASPSSRRPGRVLAGVTAAMVVVGAIVGGAYGWAFGALDASETIDVSGLTNRPDQDREVLPSGPMTLLVMGSDDRRGTRFKDEGQGASDTTLLVHLYDGRTQALVVSIPRDTMVQVPACIRPDGSTLSPELRQFNAAYQLAGPACTVRTVEELTGIYLDHFLTINLAGFTTIVEAVGGVEMCLDKDIVSEKAHVNLKAGCQVLQGDQALGYVRARYVGDGSDLSRIQRQQQFLMALARKATSFGVLANPVRLRSVLESTAAAIATDPGLTDAGDKRDLATSLRSLRPSDITFVTAPVAPWSVDRNRLVFVEDEAALLWEAIRTDAPWPPPATPGLDGKPLVTPPGEIRVRVLNGTAIQGLAGKVADDLRAMGFTVTDVANAARNNYAATVVRRPAKYDESGRTLATVAGATRTVIDPEATSTLTLIIGADFTEVTAVTIPRVQATPAPQP